MYKYFMQQYDTELFSVFLTFLGYKSCLLDYSDS